MTNSVDKQKPSITELPRSIQNIIRGIESEKNLTHTKLRKIVKYAHVQIEDLTPWTDYEHSPLDSYGRVSIYDGGYFNIMVMSWLPGDFSAIHDHGKTLWGAVQVFGEAEHGIFYVQDSEIRTLSRVQMKPGQIVGVTHELVHQMGNPTDRKYPSLHIYGNDGITHGKITEEERIIDFDEDTVQRAVGGAFFALPEDEIVRREPGLNPDFMTWLRNTTETIRRLRTADKAGVPCYNKNLNKLIFDLFDPRRAQQFLHDLEENVDDNGHNTNSATWKLLNRELQAGAKIQAEIQEDEGGITQDSFYTYADLYDEIIGKPCLEGFMGNYLQFFQQKYISDLSQTEIISIGCGTGLIERYMIENLGVRYENLYGIDISEAMIQVASNFIRAEVGDALTLDPSIRMWDMAYSGLNVFQYLDHQFLEDVISQTAKIIKPNGYFVGDFITPDHIRWYPNVIYSQNKEIVSLRTPQLIEKENCMYQRSQIMNFSSRGGKMRITDEGVHDRFLPPLGRVRHYFERAFGKVDIFDAVSLEPIPNTADTCPSTRYVVIAQRTKVES